MPPLQDKKQRTVNTIHHCSKRKVREKFVWRVEENCSSGLVEISSHQMHYYRKSSDFSFDLKRGSESSFRIRKGRLFHASRTLE